MADAVLMISWGATVRGREERALEVFNETIGLYGRMQQDGRIESFDVALCMPNGALDGYMQLHGTPAQLNAVKESEDFRTNMVDASMIVDELRLIDGVTGEALGMEIARFQQAIAKVPQTA